ncbi:HEPN domain-containing protein [uncultured Ruminococcus sp.]|uniref:HEPN domain-containing protein n=1 Tax=uncultured Ruminococcus sp. TaxID=165186 RepID=UPI0025CD91B1|nr:HEPN domain-containing protein [uncultured Ruminococcus sp.]
MTEMLDRAEEDYKICKQLEICLPDEFAVRGCVYHIQQANEKALKAYLSINGIQPPFSHDIGRLVSTAQHYSLNVPAETIRIANTLTLWESKSRYDPYIFFNKDEYSDAKTSYQKLAELIKSEMKTYLTEEKQDEDIDEPLDLTKDNSLKR